MTHLCAYKDTAEVDAHVPIPILNAHVFKLGAMYASTCSWQVKLVRKAEVPLLVKGRGRLHLHC